MSFANEPTLELRRSDAREALLAALAELDGRLPLRVPMLIGDEVRQGAEQFESTDPGTPSRVVATAALAGEPDVAAAIDAAEAGFRDWGARPAAEQIVFVNAWNELVLALVAIRNQNLRTIPLGLQIFVSDYVEWGPVFASLSMATVPVIIVYVLMQRHFIKGLTAGAIKG